MKTQSRSRVWAIALLLGCGGGQGKNYAGAAVAAGVAVAEAGIYRATTNGCWADCRPGTFCNHKSGTCVPYPENTTVGSQQPIGEEEPRDAGTDASETALVPRPRDAGPVPPCGGLCRPGERCREVAGIGECIPGD